VRKGKSPALRSCEEVVVWRESRSQCTDGKRGGSALRVGCEEGKGRDHLGGGRSRSETFPVVFLSKKGEKFPGRSIVRIPGGRQILSSRAIATPRQGCPTVGQKKNEVTVKADEQ